MVQFGRDRATTTESIAGGFVLVSVASLMTTWRACRSAPLGIGDFRAWLACREMKARRCLAEEGRAPLYSFAELAKLLGISPKRARASVNRLVVAGLLRWSDRALGFPEAPADFDPDLDDSIGRGRGSLAIPRRMLRLLVAGARPALIANALGVLLRCLSRRKGGFDGRGRVKSAWIARVFGVDLRRVKQARRELTDLGWIRPEPSGQRAENRWGRAFRIDLAWDRPAPAEGRPLPPLPPAHRPAIATPSVNQEPFQERIQDQEPGPAGPPGVRLKEVGGDDGPLPDPGSSAVPRSEIPVEAAPRLRDVRAEDLKDTGRTLSLFSEAVGLGWVRPSEADRLRFVGAAEHALAIGRGNPPGLFIHLVRGKLWRYLTQEDEDRANARIKAFQRGPGPPSVASSPICRPVRPMLSEDARSVLRVRSALASAGYRGDAFPQVRRHDPSWTRGRWDAALAELGGGR